MRIGRPKSLITLFKEEHAQLKSIVSSRSLPHSLVNRARIVLMAAEGAPNRNIAQKVNLSAQKVCKWRQRYQEYLEFFKHVDANVPQNLDIHLVVDNYSIHKHPKVPFAWTATADSILEKIKRLCQRISETRH
jgi:putative transposase